MTTANTAIDWAGWLHRWDAQQAGFLPTREARFAVMFDAIETLIGHEFVALDLACGPGSLSQRLLDRFPNARSVAVDIDPVLLALGQNALGTMNGRLRWVDADLNRPEWVQALGESSVDVVVSTTALHWLSPASLLRVYRELGGIIRPGGLLLNGDNMRFGPDMPSFEKVGQARRERLWSKESFAERGVETWEDWWESIGREPGMAELMAERERRFSPYAAERGTSPIYDVHVAGLRDAGFREAGTLWQNGTNRVLMGVR